MPPTVRSGRETEVIAATLKRRHTGVTSTVAALLPAQARDVTIAALGLAVPETRPQLAWSDFLRHAWTPPSGRHVRIWHARRNTEMLLGLFLTRVLRMPLKLVFTSAAQRHHSASERWLLRQMDRVIATSPEAASYLRVPSTVIPHGVDVERYRPAENREAQWAATDLPGRYGIGVFGRIRRQKGLDLFVEATRVGATPRLVVDGETGYLVPPEHVDLLTDRIERLFKDPARAADMGRSGRVHVVESCSIHRKAESIRRVYDQCWREAELREHRASLEDEANAAPEGRAVHLPSRGAGPTAPGRAVTAPLSRRPAGRSAPRSGCRRAGRGPPDRSMPPRRPVARSPAHR